MLHSKKMPAMAYCKFADNTSEKPTVIFTGALSTNAFNPGGNR